MCHCVGTTNRNSTCTSGDNWQWTITGWVVIFDELLYKTASRVYTCSRLWLSSIETNYCIWTHWPDEITATLFGDWYHWWPVSWGLWDVLCSALYQQLISLTVHQFDIFIQPNDDGVLLHTWIFSTYAKYIVSNLQNYAPKAIWLLWVMWTTALSSW